MADLTLIGDLGLTQAGERDETPQKAMGLAKASQFFNDAAADNAKIAGVARDVDIGDFIDERVAQRRDRTFDQGLAVAARPARGDDVIALPGLGE